MKDCYWKLKEKAINRRLGEAPNLRAMIGQIHYLSNLVRHVIMYMYLLFDYSPVIPDSPVLVDKGHGEQLSVAADWIWDWSSRPDQHPPKYDSSSPAFLLVRLSE